MQRRRVQIRPFVLQRLTRRQGRTRKAPLFTGQCAYHPRSSIPDSLRARSRTNSGLKPSFSFRQTDGPITSAAVETGVGADERTGPRRASLLPQVTRKEKQKLWKFVPRHFSLGRPEGAGRHERMHAKAAAIL